MSKTSRERDFTGMSSDVDLASTFYLYTTFAKINVNCKILTENLTFNKELSQLYKDWYNMNKIIKL